MTTIREAILNGSLAPAGSTIRQHFQSIGADQSNAVQIAGRRTLNFSKDKDIDIIKQEKVLEIIK